MNTGSTDSGDPRSGDSGSHSGGATPSATRPLVTLSWAQSLDGCIASRRDSRFRISGGESMRMTHALRARHDAILVGIGTVLADDPALTVRLVEGESPRPVILDAELKTPEGCRLMLRTDRHPWIFCSQDASRERRERLERLGARVFATAPGEAKRVDLGTLLRSLGSEGVESLMVEGGGQVLASFMRERLADEIVITLGALFLGGYNPFAADGGLQGFGPPFRLSGMRVERFGEDVVVSGRPYWDEGAPESPAGTGGTW